MTTTCLNTIPVPLAADCKIATATLKLYYRIHWPQGWQAANQKQMPDTRT